MSYYLFTGASLPSSYSTNYWDSNYLMAFVIHCNDRLLCTFLGPISPCHSWIRHCAKCDSPQSLVLLERILYGQPVYRILWISIAQAFWRFSSAELSRKIFSHAARYKKNGRWLVPPNHSLRKLLIKQNETCSSGSLFL